jgi:SAM-dependent methyltransferase
MRKDYRFVPWDRAAAGELELIEEQWTATWQQATRDTAMLAAEVTLREEYRLMQPYLARCTAHPVRVLDAGCGLGHWTLYFTSLGYEAYGVDLSRETITQLQERFPTCRFLTGDIRSLGFPSDYFDIYFSWGVFEHFEEGMERCIVEARRVLKPRGYLFVSVPFQNWRHILRDARPFCSWDDAREMRVHGTRAPRFYQWRLTAPELERELALRGLDVLRVRPIHKAEGVRRFLQRDLRLRPGTPAYALARRLATRFVPATWLAHMVLAVAQKQGT